MKTITIGRHPDNNVVINDPMVGRHHLQITQHDDGHFSVLDLNSKNGTFVNGKRVYGEVRLSMNDEIQVGRTTLPWLNYFASSTQSSRKKRKAVSSLLPIVCCAIGGVALILVMIYSGRSKEMNSDNVITERQQSSMRSNTKSTICNLSYRRNPSEDIIGQVITAPSEDGYFPSEWEWKIERGEVYEVRELSRRTDPSGYEVITVLAHLHRGEVKIDAEMILKYSTNGLESSRVTKLTIPRQPDYSQYVELEMDYDFIPALMLYNRSNMTLFVGGDYSSGDETSLFSAVIEPHSSKMIAFGNVQCYHVHFAYEK